MSIRFDGRVAIVTGAGGGLGRDHALLLSALGAKVVVNDIGGRGSDGQLAPAEAVVAEIKAKGGEAIVNHDSVAEPESAKRIVASAMDSYGRLDILINNAGILRDRSFGKVDLADLELVIKVHLLGTIYCTHAAWPIMNAQKYGRIIVTTSIAGTSGNFGQAAYSSAKMGMIGFMNTLKIEGVKNNILINAISPGAVTRMTAGLNPPAVERYMTSDRVSPVVAYLVSEQSTASGQIIEAMAGGVSRLHMSQTTGVQFDPAETLSIDMIAERFGEISDLAKAKPIMHGAEGLIETRLREIGRWEE